jgi:DNA-binding winged helix-turn-helix (wHTH) protein/tetratricopeptide (TPR) repeat protein
MSGRFAYAFGAFRFDPADKLLLRDGKPVPLTPKALDTLAVLVERHPRLVAKDELLARVWPGTFVEDNNLAQHVSLLRRVLADGAGPEPIIETIPRRGYRFCLPVTRIDEPADVPAMAPETTTPDPPLIPDVVTLASVVPPAPEPAVNPAPPASTHRGLWLAAGAAAALLLMIGATRWDLGTGAMGLTRAPIDPRGGAPGGVPDSVTASRDGDAYLAFLSARAAFAQGYSDTANQARARADLERAVAREPGFAPAWALLARVYGAQYRTALDRDAAILDAAERAALTAVKLDPRLPDGHLALAELFYSRRDHQQAREALEAGRTVLDDRAAYWHLLGFIEQREGNWRASEAAFSKGFDLDGPATAEWLAVHFLHLRQYADARRVLAVALASSRTAAVVPDAWARFSEGGDVAAAREVLEAALVARPAPDARVLGLLAQLEWFDGRSDRALELIGRMEEPGAWLSPNFRFPAAVAAADVLASLGRTNEAQAKYAEALVVLERRRASAPDDPKIVAALGLTYAGLGRPSDALQHAERAVALLPREQDAAEGPLYLYLLARVHARLGQTKHAFAVLDEMFDAPGFYSEAWVQRDPSFAALRAAPGYAAHFQRWTTRKGDALLARAALDQAANKTR